MRGSTRCWKWDEGGAVKGTTFRWNPRGWLAVGPSGETEGVLRLSPAEIVGLLTSVPLAQQTHEMLRAIAFRAVEQRLLAHVVAQADSRYGSN